MTCGRMSLREVVHAAVGKWGVVAMQLVIVVNNLGGLVVFLIIISDVLAGQQGEPGLATSLGCASIGHLEQLSLHAHL